MGQLEPLSDVDDGNDPSLQIQLDEAVLAYEDALRQVPADVRSSQRLALLYLMGNLKERGYDARSYLRRAAIRDYAQYAIYRALEFLNSNLISTDGLQDITYLLRLLRITGSPRLFVHLTSTTTNLREDDSDRGLVLLLDLHRRAIHRRDHRRNTCP